MGLFDFLKKKKTEKREETPKTTIPAVEKSEPIVVPEEPVVVEETVAVPQEMPPFDPSAVNQRFEELVNEAHFPGYTIARNVHVQTFDQTAHPCCYPISYLFQQDGAPVLAVFLMNRNQYRAMIAKGAYQVLDAHNIKRISFYREFRNEEQYILDRIQENLDI